MEYIPTYNASNASDFNKHGVIISSKIMTKVLEEKYFFIHETPPLIFSEFSRFYSKKCQQLNL